MERPLPPVTEPLAPGAPILIGDGRRRVGVAAVVILRGRLHLLTCGHAFDGPEAVFNDGGDGPVAGLTKDYFHTNEVDAAVCELTDAGLGLLRRSVNAWTWFKDIHVPTTADRVAMFWPTHEGNDGPRAAAVLTVNARSNIVFMDRSNHDGFLGVACAAPPGDSGSILAFGHGPSFYGLCTMDFPGEDRSLFTPFASIWPRLMRDFREVVLWHPDTGM